MKKQAKTTLDLSGERKKSVLIVYKLETIHMWRPWKLPNFQDHPAPLSSYVQNFSTPLNLTSNFKHPLSPHPPSPPTPTLPPPPLSKWYKRKHNPRITIKCCQVFPSGRLSFSVQYQLINLVWLSVYFFSFNWSQSFPQSNFKKLKTSPFCSFLF